MGTVSLWQSDIWMNMDHLQMIYDDLINCVVVFLVMLVYMLGDLFETVCY